MQNIIRRPRTAIVALAAATVLAVGGSAAAGYSITSQNTPTHVASAQRTATPIGADEAGLLRCIWEGGSVVGCFQIHGSTL